MHPSPLVTRLWGWSWMLPRSWETSGTRRDTFVDRGCLRTKAWSNVGNSSIVGDIYIYYSNIDIIWYNDITYLSIYCNNTHNKHNLKDLWIYTRGLLVYQHSNQSRPWIYKQWLCFFRPWNPLGSDQQDLGGKQYFPSGNLLQFAVEHGHWNSWFT